MAKLNKHEKAIVAKQICDQLGVQTTKKGLDAQTIVVAAEDFRLSITDDATRAAVNMVASPSRMAIVFSLLSTNLGPIEFMPEYILTYDIESGNKEKVAYSKEVHGSEVVMSKYKDHILCMAYGFMNSEEIEDGNNKTEHGVPDVPSIVQDHHPV